MKTTIHKAGLNFTQAVLLGLAIELFLVLIQLGYLMIYVNQNPEQEFTFTTGYMKTTGFYVFQIIGFFIYTIMVYIVLRMSGKGAFNTKIVVLVITGGIAELIFYLVIRADYELAFSYSILDKFVAAAIGAIVYGYSAPREEGPLKKIPESTP